MGASPGDRAVSGCGALLLCPGTRLRHLSKSNPLYFMVTIKAATKLDTLLL